MPWLIVGLGNPGTQYALTRHNIGFMAIDYLLKACGEPPVKKDFNASVAKFKWEGQEVITAQPLTFMNLSGAAVVPILQFYKVPQGQLIVIHDDVDLPFGGFKIQKNRGHGGQNGVRDISEKLGSADYIRIKFGIGRPAHPEMKVADHVLQKFSGEEMAALPPLLEKTVDALESLITEGLSKASTQFNK